MENISRRLSNEDTATSMYLSFDAESTMSTACYKTLETMTDVSTLSVIDLNESGNNLKTSDNPNSTLEADEHSQTKSPLKTVKKIGFLMEKKSQTPLKSKNIMKEFKALCSTPSKEQLLKTVDVTRGSDATRCIDLGLAFLGVEDEKPAYFPPPIDVAYNEDNKENAQPENEEVSTLSTCSSVEVTTTSVIERKMISSVSTVSFITEGEQIIDDGNIMKAKNDLTSTALNFETTKSIVTDTKDIIRNVEESSEKIINEDDDCAKRSVNKTPEDDVEYNKYMATIAESPEKPIENADPAMEIEEYKNNVKVQNIAASKITAPSRNLRRSICEPNLQTNKPSRILSYGDNKRKSLLPISKSNSAVDAEIEIPLLMSKMLKITKVPMKMTESNKKTDECLRNEQKYSQIDEKKSSVVASMKTRSSLIPPATGDKRPFSFKQRMSVVVKTTLNSPARKIARRSLMGGLGTSQPRRSVLPQKMATTGSSKTKMPELFERKTMMPKPSTVTLGKKTNLESVRSVVDSEAKTKITQRNSLMPSTTKIPEKTKISGVKQEVVYTCNFCKEKFRIKSLFDAHKRSHESDNMPPAFVKKSTALQQPSTGSLLGHSNQCKFCDKKFALIKALHIHLLQNCSKIPPSEKKKLQYTELNHVEKAQLPNVFNNYQNNVSSAASSVNVTPRNLPKYNWHIMNKQKSSTDLINEIEDKATSSGENSLASTQGSVQKLKKLGAHAGVYRTPSKKVPCHLCKTTFKSILDYTNHNLTMHGKVNRVKEN